MQTLLPRLPLRAPLACAALLFTLAACDRHSATEVSESYGHGSSHNKDYRNHRVDSRTDSQSFSDTQGLATDKPESAEAARPAASPAPKAGDRFFPNGN